MTNDPTLDKFIHAMRPCFNAAVEAFKEANDPRHVVIVIEDADRYHVHCMSPDDAGAALKDTWGDEPDINYCIRKMQETRRAGSFWLFGCFLSGIVGIVGFDYVRYQAHLYKHTN